MHGPDGGWILLHERADASFNFFRNWVSYENGFGKPGSDFWIGNSDMHVITFNGRHMVRFEFLEYFDERNQPLFAEYDDFKVLGPSSGYVLQVGKFRGNVANILSASNNSAFSTWDRDNDKIEGSCARIRKGAWWYGGSCLVHDLTSMLVFVALTIKVKEIFEGNRFIITNESCLFGHNIITAYLFVYKSNLQKSIKNL